MSEWKDKAKRYDNPEIESAEARFGMYRLIVHRHIHYAPDAWLASCSPSVFAGIEMASKELGEAKSQAKAKLQTILETALKELLRT